MIYFDNAATTKPILKIEEILKEYINNGWYNPSALYSNSADVFKSLDDTRKKVMSAVGGYNGDVVFTSGGTESNNIAIIGSYTPKKVNHYITTHFEHPAVYKAFKRLEDIGQEVSFVKPNDKGIIEKKDIIDEIKDNTALVSVMHVNNETGALNDINGIASSVKAKNKNILFHSDGVQGFLKTEFNISENIDYYSISSHKVGGLKGCGALYLKKGIKSKPINFGGGQEKGIRPGTENTFGIKVFDMAIDLFSKDRDKIFDLREKTIKGLCEIDDVMINSPTEKESFSPYIINVSILGVRGETLLHALEAKGILIGIGSACSSKSRTNRVHDALNLSSERGESAIRISFSNDNDIEQVDKLIKAINQEAKTLRMFKRR